MRTRAVALLLLCALSAAAAAKPQPPGAKEARVHVQKAEAYFDEGAFELALKEYEAAYQLIPAPGFLFDIGRVQQRLGHRQTALDYYHKYLEAEPKGPASRDAKTYVETLTHEIVSEEKGHTDRGGELFQKAQYDLALKEYDAAYEVQKSPELLVRIAETHRALGHRDEAKRFYIAYLDVLPSGSAAGEARAHIAEIEQQKKAEVERTQKDEARRQEEQKRLAAVTTAAEAEAHKPVYKKPIFWAITGGAAAVVVVAVVLGVVLGGQQQDPSSSIQLMYGSK